LLLSSGRGIQFQTNKIFTLSLFHA
jgi:hypothetical protein